MAAHIRRQRFAALGAVLGAIGLGVAFLVFLREEAHSGREKCTRAYAVARTKADSAKVDTLRLGGDLTYSGEQPQPSCDELQPRP